MAEETTAEAQAEERNLVLDELDERLEAFNAFRKSDSDKADEVLRELGGADPVGRDIILQLAGKRPLGHPEKFMAAHTGAIRSLEVLDRNGAKPVGAERGWKDTVLVHPGDRVRIIMQFERYADPEVPYMYHCHIMEHEDAGMMGQFLVVEETTPQ